MLTPKLAYSRTNRSWLCANGWVVSQLSCCLSFIMLIYLRFPGGIRSRHWPHPEQLLSIHIHVSCIFRSYPHHKQWVVSSWIYLLAQGLLVHRGSSPAIPSSSRPLNLFWGVPQSSWADLGMAQGTQKGREGYFNCASRNPCDSRFIWIHLIIPAQCNSPPPWSNASRPTLCLLPPKPCSHNPES